MKNNDNMSKNTIRVAPVLTVSLFIFFLIGLSVYLWMMIDRARGNPSVSIIAIIVGSVMLLVVPFLLFLYSFITMWSIVTIDEKGMHKALLKRFFKKTILWEEMVEIRTIRTIGSPWVFFSKSVISDMSLSRCKRRRDNIWVMYTQKLEKLVIHYSEKSMEVWQK